MRECNQILLQNLNHPSRIIQEWIRLAKDMIHAPAMGSLAILPQSFLQTIYETKEYQSIFDPMGENDMIEFFSFLIEQFHKALLRKVTITIDDHIIRHHKINKQVFEFIKKQYENEYSSIMELFYGITLTEIYSEDHKKKYSIRPDMFFILNLPLQSHSTGEIFSSIYQCFYEYIHPESLSGENAWQNEKTQKYENVVKATVFYKFPRILVISLKRFSADGQTKLSQYIDCPIDCLKLDPFIMGGNQQHFELYAVCNHYGNLDSGHYTCCIRENQHWYEYNDHLVTRIKKEEIITMNIYCLIYRKKITQE
jgi:ubiquitin carboxyl-terminal hydrolase 8